MTRSHDAAAGLFFLVIGVAGAAGSLRLEIGSLDQMGSGFLPLLVGLLMALIGAALLLGALRDGTFSLRPAGGLPWRPMIALGGGTLIFTAVVGSFGMAPAFFLGTLAASFASTENSWRGALIIAVVLTALCVAIFGFGLRLAIPIVQLPVWLG